MTNVVASMPCIAPRAAHVSVRERLCRIVLGSPSAAYALRDARLQRSLVHKSRARARRRASEVPVFEVDRKGWKGSERLPRVWLSEPRFDAATGRCEGRVFVEAYPHDPDPLGWHAYGLARKYFSEGLAYASEHSGADAGDYRARRVRRDCFRAAELLYLHALRAGNTAASTALATLYRYDMCEGSYWSGLLEKRARHRKPVDPRRRALRLLEQAAEAGNAEGLFGLGEMLAEGCGCERDEDRAFRCFAETFGRCGSRGSEELAGRAALRIAHARAEGAGTVLDPERARAWYATAVDLLQIAFDAGQWRCKRQLVEARLGIACMDQELSGAY